MSLGPNVKKLWATKMASDAIPAGGGLADGIAFLSSRESISSGAKAASEWTKNAIEAIRNAADPNPFRNSTDEEIAAEILRKIAERQKGK